MQLTRRVKEKISSDFVKTKFLSLALYNVKSIRISLSPLGFQQNYFMSREVSSLATANIELLSNSLSSCCRPMTLLFFR